VRRRALDLIDLAQRHNEREDALFVVTQVPLVVARLDAPEGEGGAVGETEGVYRGGDILSERHEARLPAELDSPFGELLCK
jgi:hypothetical protein